MGSSWQLASRGLLFRSVVSPRILASSITCFLTKCSLPIRMSAKNILPIKLRSPRGRRGSQRLRASLFSGRLVTGWIGNKKETSEEASGLPNGLITSFNTPPSSRTHQATTMQGVCGDPIGHTHWLR
ncbi:hypothetical protein B0H65DRAFT_23839 [Neurospora tetraspora]|uniref:Uncharacterized protein n=1 Tax=Neurospora tetraspora TaxID=94610 RepID=A0AAE0JNC2_9PEZI|nr:hypothetical protein B0H65DRAFT_23839 [Neurospora tetraspora]